MALREKTLEEKQEVEALQELIEQLILEKATRLRSCTSCGTSHSHAEVAGVTPR